MPGDIHQSQRNGPGNHSGHIGQTPCGRRTKLEQSANEDCIAQGGFVRMGFRKHPRQREHQEQFQDNDRNGIKMGHFYGSVAQTGVRGGLQPGLKERRFSFG